MHTIKVLALDIDGVITDGGATLDANASEVKRIDFHDLDAVTQAKREGLQIAFVTGEDNAMVDTIGKRFGIEEIVRGSKDKVAALKGLAERLGVSLEEICFVGDSDRDAPAMESAGLGLAPANSTPLAKASADRVLHASGGSGAVAEAVRLLLAMKASKKRNALLASSAERIIKDSIDAHQKFLDASIPTLIQVAQVLLEALRTGHKIMLFGNGGSAADAQHVAGELVGRFLKESEPWPAMALTTDSSILTCVGNDWEFSDVFARQVRALARPGDVVVGITTSGNSPNVLRGLEDARKKGATTIGFTGTPGGKLSEYSDICFCAPVKLTPRIQELHLLAWHTICEIVEAEMLGGVEGA